MRALLVFAQACMRALALPLCRDAGLEAAKADAKQFANPLLRDDEDGDDDKEDGDAARKK